MARLKNWPLGVGRFARIGVKTILQGRLDMRAKEIDCTALKLMLEGIEVGRQFKRFWLQAVGSQR